MAADNYHPDFFKKGVSHRKDIDVRLKAIFKHIECIKNKKSRVGK